MAKTFLSPTRKYMSKSNLDCLFKAKTIALIGATTRPGSVGLAIVRNLITSKGKVFFVNPNRKKILGKKSYNSLLEIKDKIDLAVIAVPRKHIISVAKDCLWKGIKAAVVITAGFSETGREGRETEEELKAIFRKGNIKFLGPNCLGFIAPWQGINASFAPSMANRGEIAFLSQSGSIIDTAIEKVFSFGAGFSAVVSYGNSGGIKINELIDYFSKDKRTKTIAIYLEAVKNGQNFINSLKSAAKEKPIIILKGGKTDFGNKAIASHTASMGSLPKIYSAAFEKGGAFEVEDIDELFSVSSFFSLAKPKMIKGKTAILTNGGAYGVLMADWLAKFSVPVAKIGRREGRNIFPETIKISNPLDILGDASPERYRKAVDFLLNKGEVSLLILIESMQMMTKPLETAKIIAEKIIKFKEKIIIPVFAGDNKEMVEAKNYLAKNKIPFFESPKQAAVAAKFLS